jgi:hypothetical protein
MLALNQAMSVYSPTYHAMVFSPAPVASTGAAPAAATTADGKPAAQDEGFFHHLLDVINPLQHLPVISTIYRVITGEHIGTIEKIAGDALYGGLWGAVASVADVAFEAVTGKSVEDTALAWFKSDSKANVAVASAQVMAPAITTDGSLPSSDLPALPSTAVAANIPSGPDIAALTGALSAKGVDPETAGRALYAYRRSMGMAAPQPVLASVN